MPPPAGLDALHALLAYEGVGRELVARLKYRNARAPLRDLAWSMALLVAGDGAPAPFDVVTWAPTSVHRRRARGFDQARLLAVEVGRGLGLSARRLLVRRGPGTQTGRDLAARRCGPSFGVAGNVLPRVLLVDDVVTTGATMSSAARALRGAGAGSVVGLTAARTPLKVISRTSETEV